MKWLTNTIIIFIFLGGCLESEYTRLVKAEMDKEVRQDSLFFGIYLGDKSNDFYRKCYELNKRRLVAQGPSNSSVQYVFMDSAYHETPTPIRMLFYPKFDKNMVINSMDLEFSYNGWAPWNDKFQADDLKPVVLQMLMDWYGGNDFIDVEINNNELPVKVDGNRRILVFLKDTQSVVVRIQDILHPDYQHSIAKKII